MRLWIDSFKFIKKIKKLESLGQNQTPYRKEKVISQTPSIQLKKEVTRKQSLTETEISNITEDNIKKKYENAIKMLWANKYDQAEQELLQLKQIKPKDLMPNIQYWLGEVYYAKKDFSQAVIEFGEGFSNYPDSIKGPDNLLKLGLSFSNLNKKNEACSAFYELEVKYKSSPKNVLERSQEERKKLDCPRE